MRRIHFALLLLFLVVSMCIVGACSTSPTAGSSSARSLAVRSLADPEGDAFGAFFVAHGHGSTVDEWPSKLVSAIRETELSLDGWVLAAYDWASSVSPVFGAPRRGYAIGKKLGKRLADTPYEVLHLVGHSMGAHLVQGLVDAYRKAGGTGYVHMTFLDPFSPRGLFSWRYGEHHFGEGADYAESYMVTEDGVPGTDRYLRHAHNYDVTALVPDEYRDPSGTSPHWWTVRYYRNTVANGRPGFGLSPLAKLNQGDNPQEDPRSASGTDALTKPVAGTVTVLGRDTRR
jgi:hypothetical protein